VIATTSVGSSASERCDAAGRRQHHAESGALLAAELGGDQVGRLLRVRARDLEVVDQLAVERGVQADQQSEHDEPAPDHALRMARAAPGDPR
jgi:hypothetical protein